MTRTDCAAFLRQKDNFCILTHLDPDGDALGSAAGLCLGLRALGKTAFVLENPQTPENLAFLCEGLTVAAPAENAVLVSVDVASPRIFMKNPSFDPEKIQLRIDHHGRATSFAPLELIEPEMASCAELIYDILMEMGVKLTREIAIALYTGLSTDTGCFKFANTTAHTFRVAAACADTGANLQPINQAMFDTVSLGRLRLQSWITENTQFYADGQVAVCVMPMGLANSVGAKESEMTGLSGFVRSIAGVKLAALVQAQENGNKISVRAIPGYDAAAICEIFGGGGHKGAGGAASTLSPEETGKGLAEAMLEQLNSN